MAIDFTLTTTQRNLQLDTLVGVRAGPRRRADSSIQSPSTDLPTAKLSMAPVLAPAQQIAARAFTSSWTVRSRLRPNARRGADAVINMLNPHNSTVFSKV